MLVAMETEDSLRRGAIMVIAKKIGLACAEQQVHASWVLLILQNFFAQKSPEEGLCTL